MKPARELPQVHEDYQVRMHNDWAKTRTNPLNFTAEKGVLPGRPSPEVKTGKPGPC